VELDRLPTLEADPLEDEVSHRILTALVAVFALAVTTRNVIAQPATGKPSPWDPLRYFLGTWTGIGAGQPGSSAVERQYEFVLGGRFIEVSNKATYAPQDKNPKGELHEDRGFISWDRARRRFVLRQFHVEGFVSQYVADSVAVSPDSIVFRSESIENIPAGFRARETYRILGPDEFVERFEIAEPGKDFTVYSEARLERKD
jgi:hypothetical protein